MKVSIIIPCYNNAEHLPKCIESVLNQTVTDFELLLLNDGSTDATLAICDDFQKNDVRIKVYSHQNKGVSYTRNRGIDLAQADYIMFIDGDDWIENDMLALLMESNPSADTLPVCGMIHERRGKVFVNDFFQNLINKKKLEFNKDELFSLFPSSVLNSPCCKIYSRIILINNNIKFEEKLSYQEDLIFTLQYLSLVQNIKIVPAFKYHYVEHVMSSSNRFHQNLNASVFKVTSLLLALSNYNNSPAVQKFNIDQVIKLISNILHKNSGLNVKQKYVEINAVLNSTIFEESKEIINKMQLGKLLEIALLNKKPILIMMYFGLNKIFK